jgi:hypothetical protein
MTTCAYRHNSLIDTSKPSIQDWAGTRDDITAFVDETAPWLPPPVRSTIQLLKGFAEALQEPYANAMATQAHEWRLRQGDVLLPAKINRPLTLCDGAQLASFAPGGQYIIHSDNSFDSHMERRNYRTITAIAYAQPADWTAEDEGSLRIWLNSDHLDPFHLEPAETEQLIRETLAENWRKEHGSDTDQPHYVDIMPKAGRVVLFRSTLLHQVCVMSTLSCTYTYAHAFAHTCIYVRLDVSAYTYRFTCTSYMYKCTYTYAYT